MAWNEPGGGNNKDPWGGRGDQGPPDLDEVVRKMQDKLGGLFGGRKRGGGRMFILTERLTPVLAWDSDQKTRLLSGLRTGDRSPEWPSETGRTGRRHRRRGTARR